MGRLTSTIVHQVGNPMQAIRGALALALEDPDNHEELLEFIQLSFLETERVLNLLSLIREIYRPQSLASTAIPVSELLEHVNKLTKHELESNDIRFSQEIDPETPSVLGITNQVYLTLLSVILNLSAWLQTNEGDHLHLLARPREHKTVLILTTRGSNSAQETDNLLANLAPARQILQTMHGELNIDSHASKMQIELIFPSASVGK